MILSFEVFYLFDITSEVLPEWRKTSNMSYPAPDRMLFVLLGVQTLASTELNDRQTLNAPVPN